MILAMPKSIASRRPGRHTRKIMITPVGRRSGCAMLHAQMALSGYPPEDLLLRAGFRFACEDALAELAKETSGVTLLVGHPHLKDNKLYNAASLIRDGGIVATYLKNLLPNDSVFDERRYFEPGSNPCIFELDGIKFGINICQDVWQEGAATRAREAGAACYWC